jgi:hypothetical protein
MNIDYRIVDGQRVRLLEHDKDGWIVIATDEGNVGMDCWRDHNGHRECSARCSAFQIHSHNGRPYALCRALQSSEGISHQIIGEFRSAAGFAEVHP